MSFTPDSMRMFHVYELQTDGRAYTLESLPGGWTLRYKWDGRKHTKRLTRAQAQLLLDASYPRCPKCNELAADLPGGQCVDCVDSWIDPQPDSVNYDEIH